MYILKRAARFKVLDKIQKTRKLFYNFLGVILLVTEIINTRIFDWNGMNFYCLC